jgi:hypothetical protein
MTARVLRSQHSKHGNGRKRASRTAGCATRLQVAADPREIRPVNTSTTKVPPVIGRLRPCRTYLTGFGEYRSPTGIHGLAKADLQKKELQLLVVMATRPGTGQFREFMTQCKTAYDHIRFWDVFARQLVNCLPRYGFERGWDLDPEGKKAEVWDWHKTL